MNGNSPGSPNGPCRAGRYTGAISSPLPVNRGLSGAAGGFEDWEGEDLSTGLIILTREMNGYSTPGALRTCGPGAPNAETDR